MKVSVAVPRERVSFLKNKDLKRRTAKSRVIDSKTLKLRLANQFEAGGRHV